MPTNPLDYTDLDAFSLTLEKIEHLISLALDGEAQGKSTLLTLTMVADYVAELRRLATEVAIGGAR